MADGMFGSIASGAASGAGKGAAIGSIIPGVGTLAGGAIGAIAGGAMAGGKQKKSNDAQKIPLADPRELARLSEITQTRKSINAGTDAMTQLGIQQQQNAGRSAQAGISRATGGDVGGTIDALLKSQRATQSGQNNVIAQAGARLPYFEQAQTGLLDRITQRKLELGLLNRSQRVAEAAQAQTDNNINKNALLATQGGTQTIAEGAGQVASQMGQNPLMSIISQMIQKGQANKNLANSPEGSGYVSSDAFANTQNGSGYVPSNIPILTDPSIGNVPLGGASISSIWD
jgi:hypothetical protein